MREKATAGRPPANPPILAVVHATVPSLGQQLREVLPPRRLHSISLCDHDANVLWLSEGALGPDEHAVIVEALEVLAADTSMPCHEKGLEDGRHALFLPVRAPSGNLVGIAMILADCKSVGDDTVERMTTSPVRAIMQRLAVLLKPGAAHKAGDTHAGGTAAIPVLELTAESVVAVAAAGISPEQVNDILELELVYEATPAPPASRLNGSAGAAEIKSSSHMLSLEFIEDAPAAAPNPPRAARRPAVPTMPAERLAWAYLYYDAQTDDGHVKRRDAAAAE